VRDDGDEWNGRITRTCSSMLSETAAIAIIENVPHAFGSELLQSVCNPATISVK
jgi:hypothetical protein